MTLKAVFVFFLPSSFRTLRDANNLSAKRLTRTTVVRLLLFTVLHTDSSEMRLADVSANSTVMS
jgi:hypothetical protein